MRSGALLISAAVPKEPEEHEEKVNDIKVDVDRSHHVVIHLELADVGSEEAHGGLSLTLSPQGWR